MWMLILMIKLPLLYKSVIMKIESNIQSGDKNNTFGLTTTDDGN